MEGVPPNASLAPSLINSLRDTSSRAEETPNLKNRKRKVMSEISPIKPTTRGPDTLPSSPAEYGGRYSIQDIQENSHSEETDHLSSSSDTELADGASHQRGAKMRKANNGDQIRLPINDESFQINLSITASPHEPRARRRRAAPRLNLTIVFDPEQSNSSSKRSQSDQEAQEASEEEDEALTDLRREKPVETKLASRFPLVSTIVAAGMSVAATVASRALLSGLNLA